MQNPDDDMIRAILTGMKRGRCGGLVAQSRNAPRTGSRPFLKARGMRVIPVNPGQAGGQSHGGEVIRASLSDIPSG